MDKVIDTARSSASAVLILMLCALVMIVVLAAGTAVGQVRDRAAIQRADAARGAGTVVPDRTVAEARVVGVAEAVSRAGGPAADAMPPARSSVLPASMEWAGPVSQDERRQEPRKLSSEERTLLRQEIRRASEEVYAPYRSQKR